VDTVKLRTTPVNKLLRRIKVATLMHRGMEGEAMGHRTILNAHTDTTAVVRTTTRDRGLRTQPMMLTTSILPTWTRSGIIGMELIRSGLLVEVRLGLRIALLSGILSGQHCDEAISTLCTTTQACLAFCAFAIPLHAYIAYTSRPFLLAFLRLVIG
jgi:hypothetical protein